MDHTAIINELGKILRGEHPAWEGDRRANGYHFLTKIADDMPESAEALGLDLARNLADFAESSGVSRPTLILAAKILQGARQGSL